MTEKQSPLKNNPPAAASVEEVKVNKTIPPQKEGESGGQSGPEPTRFGDWEKGGRCTD
ncbi:MAG: DUF1674 domain-containing protein, partial [Alphaproteobacteria bacterium]|nr:DUF1674 domain-containing protein [Alphaproteobacteria bacterium]